MALCDKSIFAMISKCTIYYFFSRLQLELHDHMTFLEGIYGFSLEPSPLRHLSRNNLKNDWDPICFFIPPRQR